VDFVPLDLITQALQVTQTQLAEKLDLLRQMTGMSDIIRGQATDGDATATEQRIKARFGSVRMERRQKELAAFVSDLQRLRAEVMAKHFDESTYLARCNCQNTSDAQLAPEAVKLLKSNLSKYRIEVKPETISMTDFDALKQERTEVIAAVSQYLTSAAPLGQSMPGSTEYLLEILQWFVAGLRGASTIEGVLDRAIAAAQQAAQQAQANPQQPPPDPKLQQLQLKGQLDAQKSQMDLHADAVRAQLEVQAETQKQRIQTQENLREQGLKDRMKLQLQSQLQALKPKPMPGNGGGL
jgi:hypothetical protein